MKGKDTMKTAVGILAVLMGLCPLLSAAETAKSPAILLQEALYQEQTEGNLDKAIELYGQVLKQRRQTWSDWQRGQCINWACATLKKATKPPQRNIFDKSSRNIQRKIQQ